jgi:hypothetical protein
MALVDRYHVENPAHGTALFLAYNADLQTMFWTSSQLVEPFEYETEQEAQDDADKHGGEVFQFQRLMRRTDVESFTGHNAESRLQRHFREAAE